MKSKIKLISAALLGGTLLGCGTLPVLKQPTDIPVYINTYRSSKLHSQLNDISCQLNLVNVVEQSQIGERTISGKIELTQLYPVRPIVEAEFSNLIKENLKMGSGAEQPKLEMKIETRKSILTIDGKRLTFDLALSIMLIDPRHEGKPYFSRIYTQKTRGDSFDEVHVPNCVYKATQFVLRDFLNDLASDAALVQWIRDLGQVKEK